MLSSSLTTIDSSVDKEFDSANATSLAKSLLLRDEYLRMTSSDLFRLVNLPILHLLCSAFAAIDTCGGLPLRNDGVRNAPTCRCCRLCALDATP